MSSPLTSLASLSSSLSSEHPSTTRSSALSSRSSGKKQYLTLLRRGNKKRARNRGPSTPIAFQGKDIIFKVNVFQWHDEPGRNPNQFKKTPNKIKDIFSIDHEASHLLEPLFLLEDSELNEPTETADDASKAKFIRWELEMNKYLEDDKLTKEGNFSLWTTIIGQSSDLSTTKIKGLKYYEENEKERDYKWLLSTSININNSIESSDYPVKFVADESNNYIRTLIKL